MKRKAKNTLPDSVVEHRRTHAKPQPERVVLKSGAVRFFGVRDSAAWLGCSASALGLVLRDVPGRGNVIRSKAMAEFPELFPGAETPKAKRGKRLAATA